MTNYSMVNITGRKGGMSDGEHGSCMVESENMISVVPEYLSALLQNISLQRLTNLCTPLNNDPSSS